MVGGYLTQDLYPSPDLPESEGFSCTRSRGRGESVIMLHGNPTWSFYRNLVLGLSGTHRVIATDHIGAAYDKHARTARLTLRSRVDDLAALIERPMCAGG